MSADAGPRRFSAARLRESSELLSEFDNVAVRVGDVERPFMPWPIHRSAEDLDPKPSQPLRFTVYVFDQEADLAAGRVATFATDEPGQPRPLEKRELGVIHLELDVTVALDPHVESDHVAVERQRPPKRLYILDDVIQTHEIHRIDSLGAVGSHSAWRMGTALPAASRNSHPN